MSKSVIKVEALSKLYRLGEVGTGSLAHDVNRWWHRIRGKEDPYTQVGQVNDRTKKAESDWVYALNDINFELRQGEVLGIVGGNGAGKSTLLKVLSRVTAPTSGTVRVRGRIAALLEVGTGFHPELTGRENIFLNGAILGMTKAEIHSKLEQIVDFSGCEAYLDTPVKRYSSGMYVRLAFAVAAHLEPEILIVDEILAVGDAEFQKKCLGRMSDVAREGRTVLFVSHNIAAVQRLCSVGLHLQRGCTSGIQSIEGTVLDYVTEADRSDRRVDLRQHQRSAGCGVLARIVSLEFIEEPVYGKTWDLAMAVECADEVKQGVISISLNTLEGARALTLDSDFDQTPLVLHKGTNHVHFCLQFNPLHPGRYAAGCSVWLGNHLLDSIVSAAVWDVGAGDAHQFQVRGFGGCRPAITVTNSYT